HGRSLKPLAKRRVFLELLDDFRNSHLVSPEEEAAAEWWKPNSQDQTEVDIANIGHDFVFQHPRRLDEHRQKQPVGNFLLRKLSLFTLLRFRDQLRGFRAVGTTRRLSPLGRPVVKEPLTNFLTDTAALE